MADTPHSFRVPGDLWQEAREAAERQGTNVTAILNRALRELVERDRAERAFAEGITAGAAS